MQTLLKRGFSPTVQSVNRLLSSLLRAGRYRLLLHVFSQVTSNSVWTDSFADNLVVRAFLKTGRFEEPEDRIAGGKESRLSRKKGLWDALIQGVCVVGKDPEKGFGLLLKCVRSNAACPSQHTFRSLVFSFSSAGRMDRAIEVVETMISTEVGYPSTITSWGKPELGLGFFRERQKKSQGGGTGCFSLWLLASGYVNNGAVGEALGKHKLMVDRGIKPDVVNYSILADGFCKEGNVEKVIGLLGMMSANGAEPNLITYTSILQGFCKRGKLKEATSLLRKLEELGLPVDDLRKEDLEMVFKLLDEMEKKGVEMGTVTHNTVINGSLSTCFHGDIIGFSTLLCGYLREMNKPGVLEIVNRMEEAKTPMDVVGCNIIISAYFFLGMFEDALLLFRRMPEMGLAANSATFMSVINGCCKLGMVDGALEVIDEYVSTPRVINVLILFLCKKNVEKALWLLNQMAKRDVSYCVSTAIVESLKRVGRIEEAYKLVVEAKENGMAVDVVAYSIVVDGLCKEGHLEKALMLCTRMRDLVINGLCRQGCLIEALRMFDAMGPNDVTPTVVTYATLIHALATEGHLTDARKLFEKMISSGIPSNLRVYSILINGYCRFGAVEEAMELLQQLEETSMQPDPFTVSSLVNGFCVLGDMEGALGFYADYKRRGIALDFLGFLLLIEGLRAKGRLEEARSILWDMLQCQSIIDIVNKPNIEIEGGSLLGSLAFLCEQGRIDEAIVVLCEVGSFTSPIGRFIGDCRRAALKRSYKGDEDLSMGNRVENLDREDLSSPVQEFSEEDDRRTNLGLRTPKLCHSDLVSRKGDGQGLGTEDVEDLIGRSEFHDFDLYYPVIASLCSKGELQKASYALKHVMANSGKHS
ncbi:unnamed protein product [Spirodela intermedia]|uniref:Uncharacterized protein n=1 Tax=Spirodela intermedia TaxID=51605 RepID=A0A7I8IXQ3_SPIIN|nr:unnamed protein product [Spirodela intermedia]CAA6662356.1 unnamed protein product [Spirodela intermedia]